MKSVKWVYACSLAIALGMLSFGAVSCHDDDDPQPEKGEVVDTPKPVVEYYIMGTVTSGGDAQSGVKVKVGDKNCTTDAKGKFSVTENATGKYEVEVTSTGYLSQKTSVVIADNAENRSVVTVDLSLTKESPKKEVVATEGGKVSDESESNEDIKEPGEVAPDKVEEDRPLVKVDLTIPAGAIDEAENQGIVEDGKVDISVTTFVPAPEEVTTEVKAAEENKEVEKSIPVAAAKFEPTGLKFKNPVTISIPNPIPGIEFDKNDIQLTYQNPTTGVWEKAKDKNGNAITVSAGTEAANYTAPVDHFSSYAIENKVKSKISKETVTTDLLGQASRDNTENPKAVTGIELKYKEKAGWDYTKSDLAAEVRNQLGAGASNETVNAMVAFLKTRMFSLMGSVSGITETERVYNTVNVNGYTTMSYTCYAKVRTTTLSVNVKFNGSPKTVSITATRYTGTDHQYKTATYNPGHSGGQGGTN